MTRKSIYGVAVVAFVAGQCIARWREARGSGSRLIVRSNGHDHHGHYRSRVDQLGSHDGGVALLRQRDLADQAPQASGVRIHSTYGLHQLCSSLTKTCEPFPRYEDCQGSNRYFCSMWRSVGWMMSFAVVLEGMTLVAYVAILAGGRQKRESGWKVLSFLLMLTAVVQCAGMAIVVRLPRVECLALPLISVQ